MAKSKRRVPKNITIKIPKALRKSKMLKSFLAGKWDTALLSSAIVSAIGAAAAVLARQESGRDLAPFSTRSSMSDAVPVVRVGSPKPASDSPGDTSAAHEINNPQHSCGEEADSQMTYPTGAFTQAA